MPTHSRRLVVRPAPDAPNPRDADNLVGTLVLHPALQMGAHTYTLAHEGNHAAEIITRLQPGTAGSLRDAYHQAVAWLTIEHDTTAVLPVWAHAHERTGELRLYAGDTQHTPSDRWRTALAGLIYDTPQRRHRSGVAEDQVMACLLGEVFDYDQWRRGNAFQFAIEQLHDDSTWKAAASGVYYSRDQARRAGEQDWRRRYGAIYVEPEPRGPAPAGEPGGDAQLSGAWMRQFVRPLTDGVHHGVVEVECYVCNDTADLDEPARPALTQVTTYTVCTDPDDPCGTRTASYQQHLDRPTPPDVDRWDDAARALCAAFDPTDLAWDGEAIL